MIGALSPDVATIDRLVLSEAERPDQSHHVTTPPVLEHRPFSIASTFFPDGERCARMSIRADDFEKYLREDDDDEPLGDALAALAVDVEVDAVEAVRELRERT